MSEPLDAQKDPLEDLQKAQKAYEVQKHPETCPSCGYCPHCGRRNEPYDPYRGTYIWSYWPPTPFIVTCSAASTRGNTTVTSVSSPITYTS